MPTSKSAARNGKPSVTELHLNLPEFAAPKQQTNAKRTGSKPTAVNKSRCGENGSFNMLTVQNLQFPNAGKPLLRVADGGRTLVEDTSKSSSRMKVRGYDFTSSTNSNYENWAFSVPKQFKPKCSASTPTQTTTLTTTATTTKTTPPTQPPRDFVTSREMEDSHHEGSQKRLNFNGPEWKKPCKESFVAGAPRAFIGTCPLNIEKLSKMSTTHQKFFLTQDPRKTHCLRNPEVLRNKAYSRKKEFDTLTKMVKHADNVCAASISEKSESFICEVIDTQNPLQLDFQGLDYKNTYEKDEQDVQNQRMYRRVCRYMERRRVRKETKELVETELQEERLAVPECFAVVDRNEVVKSTSSIESIRYGKLFRAADKPFNKEVILAEEERRRQRYKDLYVAQKAKKVKEEEERKRNEDLTNEQLRTTLAKKHFEQTVQNINEAFQRSFIQERMLRRKEIQRRIFPHTMRETLRLKKTLKVCNRIRRDKALVKREFYLERLGQEKNYPEAALQISSDSPKQSSTGLLSEQSTNDEDAFSVGKDGDQFKLRGFQFKLGKDLRGKLHQKDLAAGQRTEKGCITREQWLAELAPKKPHIKLDVEEGIQKVVSPDNPNLRLFHPQMGFRSTKHVSAVHEYVQKRLGRHYDRTHHKHLKLVSPRLKYVVKKFNLISFLFDDAKRPKKTDVDKHEKKKHDNDDKNQPQTTLEYIDAKHKMCKQNQLAIKEKRMQLLGIPCLKRKKSRLQTLCENSESDTDSDWVPERESELPSEDSEYMERIMESKNERIPIRQRGNMPAPHFRETTLRCHPRHPRDYRGQRVPSEIFDETVKNTEMPHMLKLTDDINFYENVRLNKKPYTDLFEARHHHDHWNPTQKKVVDVHYQTNIVQPETTKAKCKTDKQIIQNFRMANPPCNAFVEMDLTMPSYDIEGMIKAHLQNLNKRDASDTAKERTRDVCKEREFVFHSRPPEDFENLEYPGRQEYLNLLHEMRQLLYETKQDDSEGKETLLVDKSAMIAELEEDLKSIESCLTSLDSSECTNLTNDSGSFLLMDGKTKVPLDYIRKSLVPFEELQRSRFQVKPIDVEKEDANPFKTLPFSGQVHDQIALAGMRDTFFTFNTRLKNGLRLRLEVPIVDVRKALLGPAGRHKYPGLVTTDIDEDFVKDLGNRPHVKTFSFKSGRSFIKDALRLKFESMLIQGQTVRTKIYDRLNELNWENMLRAKELYEKLFAKWEKVEYDAAMAVVYKVKTYYDVTDELRREFRELERERLILNMTIVFMEGHWIQRIMIQNFHYLLADHDWRFKHDWIHRIENSNSSNSDENENEDEEEEMQQESYEDSIAKRGIVNIRQRDKDDALAIKAYYENVYLQNLHPKLVVFPDAESFNKGINNLKVKTFVLLLEMHFTLSIHTEVQGCLETFVDWCQEDLQRKQEYVERKCAKKYFMDARANGMKRQTLSFLQGPIESSFNEENFNRDRAILIEVWRHIVPETMRGSAEQDPDPIDMVALLCDVILDLLSKFENIPSDLSQRVEFQLRRRRAYLRKLSFQAYQTERRIDSEMKKVRKNLEPPYVRPPRKGKLPRYRLKKKPVPVVYEERYISEHAKLFYRAFHDDQRVAQMDEARDSLYVIDNIQQQIVPFYFDHFLKLNGYTPNYNFKTQVELRDGQEYERLKVRSVVPELQDKMLKWEEMRKKIMEDNIQRNPQMYENVQF